MKTINQFIIPTLIILFLVGCGIFRPSDPSHRKKEIFERSDGIKVTCFQPPPDVYISEVNASIDAKIPVIAEHLEAITSVNSKVERIREELPSLNSVEALEFRMCVAYGNEAINSEQYNRFVENILPLMNINTGSSNHLTESQNNIGENYMRLFGALEAPIVMRLITGTQEGYNLNEANVLMDTTYSSDFDCSYCGGHIDQSIIDFWRNKWEYSNILPLNTDLWKKIIENYYELDLFWTASITNEEPYHFHTRNAWCFVNSIFPWNVREHTREWILQSDSGRNLCNDKVSQDIGFLYLILENFSEHRLDDLNLYFNHYSNNEAEIYHYAGNGGDEEEFEKGIIDITRTDYISRIGAAKEKEILLEQSEEKKLFFPKLQPEQSIIWILGVYIKDEKGYPKAYLSDITKPTKISYMINGQEFQESIRQPAKEMAIKVTLPFGWYGQ